MLHYRPFICVQLPEPTRLESEEHKAGYKNIAEITKERLRRSAKNIRDKNPMWHGDTGFRVFKLNTSNITAWRPNRSDIPATLLANLEHIEQGRSTDDVLYEVLLKLGLELCTPIQVRNVSGKSIHSVGQGTLIACLDSQIKREETEALAIGICSWRREQNTSGETTVIFRDSAFENDVVKSNMAAILEQNGIAKVRSL